MDDCTTYQANRQPGMAILKIGDYQKLRLQANVAQQDAIAIRPVVRQYVISSMQDISLPDSS
ncbi:MAG: hypothetical protein GDA43_06980 [Hormoscilla sp. SP5CHS1]|nr:hypothetical protein [Hormoscilla sp. SP12CHS1]MBC6452979.1 hypothetical protein [Hormoscilla sp. SP5CHS1]